MMLNIFMCLFAMYMFSLMRCFFRSFVYFLIGHNCLVLTQLLNFKGSLCILHTVLLSDMFLQLFSSSL